MDTFFISPQPSEDLQIALQWDGEPVEFNSSVSYACAEEETYFEWNRTMEEYNITCQPGGTWDIPKIWPQCLACEYHHTVITHSPSSYQPLTAPSHR